MSEYHLDTSLSAEVAASLDAFTLAYIEAAMWLLTDDKGNSLDYLGLHDVAPETITKVQEECNAFRAERRTAVLLRHAGDDAQNGHDFFLTRNHHGVGYWDRGYDARVGTGLTKAAHAWGSDDWYVGDDGLVYRG